MAAAEFAADRVAAGLEQAGLTLVSDVKVAYVEYALSQDRLQLADQSVAELEQIFDAVVWSVPSVRSDLFAIKRLPIDTTGGGYVPLEAVADVTLAPTPNEITREGGSRRIDVTTNVRDRDLGAVAEDIQAALANVQFPEGVPRRSPRRVRGARGITEPVVRTTEIARDGHGLRWAGESRPLRLFRRVRGGRLHRPRLSAIGPGVPSYRSAAVPEAQLRRQRPFSARR